MKLVTKEFFKEELIKIKKTLKPKQAKSYKTLSKIKKENWLNNDQKEWAWCPVRVDNRSDRY